jgi:hypothetical protein
MVDEPNTCKAANAVQQITCIVCCVGHCGGCSCSLAATADVALQA